MPTNVQAGDFSDERLLAENINSSATKKQLQASMYSPIANSNSPYFQSSKFSMQAAKN